MTLVICRQLAPRIGDLASNCRLSVAAVQSAVAAGAGIIILPELVTSGYVFESRHEAVSVAITPDDPLFTTWAHELTLSPPPDGAVVIAGFVEYGEDGTLYNSAAVVDAGGLRAVYRKVHLWDREKLWFAPGDDLPPVVETPAGRIGVAICYDLEFPELVRHLALAGADLIAVPTNWPLVARPAHEHPPEVVIAMAAARTNRVAIACCDRRGTERGVEWTAGTTIIGSDGWPLAVADSTDQACVDLDLGSARDKRLSEHNDALGDRRPDVYQRSLLMGEAGI